MKEIIVKSFACKKPSGEQLAIIFAPVKTCVEKLNALNKDRDFPLNYVKCMNEIVSSVNWVVIVCSFFLLFHV